MEKEELLSALINSKAEYQLDIIADFEKSVIKKVIRKKRFYAACAAMQGILSNSFWVGSEKSINYEKTVSISFKMADEILKQENQ